MTIWYQACPLDGKIRSFDVLKETPHTVTFYSNWKQQEITLNKRSKSLFCFDNWSDAYTWLVDQTNTALAAERISFNEVQQKHGHLRTPEDIRAMFQARRKLSLARDLHGHAKGLKEPK